MHKCFINAWYEDRAAYFWLSAVLFTCLCVASLLLVYTRSPLVSEVLVMLSYCVR